jgi:hypothetical protein
MSATALAMPCYLRNAAWFCTLLLLLLPLLLLLLLAAASQLCTVLLPCLLLLLLLLLLLWLLLMLLPLTCVASPLSALAGSQGPSGTKGCDCCCKRCCG